MVITDQAQFEQLVQEVRDQILSESQGVGEVDIVDNLNDIYSLPALKVNDSGEQVVEAPLSLLSAPAEEAAATANAAAQAANTAAESANNAAQSATQAVEGIEDVISDATLAAQKAETSAEKANTAADTANQAAQKADDAATQVLSGESERVEAENARQAAETERQSAEEERKSAEEARKLAEQSREEAEASRVSAEESRVTAESERVTAESSRTQAETERVQKESERESAEQTRQDNENTRVQQEQTRQINEEQRVSAESSRETEYADLKQRADALIDDNEAAIENANAAAENANAAIANMENTYAKKDEIPDVSEFVTTTVDNLVNYYKKSETYTKEEINGLIGSSTGINFKVVDSLPETGESNIIYLVPSSKQEEKNIKDEYIWIDGNWELIGSTKIDLSNYYTKDEVNSTFALKTELSWDTITDKPSWIGSTKPTYTASEVGLGNVGNFKAVSTVANQGLSEQEKSNARANIGSGTSSFSGSYNDLTDKPSIPTVGNGTITVTQNGTSKGSFTLNQSGSATIALTDTTYSTATTSANGLMSSTDKSKLDGIASNANNYVHPTTSGNKHIPSGGSSGQILRWSADGTATWGADNNTTYSQATSTTLGLVKIGYAENGKNYPVELSNGQMFVNVPWTDNNTTYSQATSSALGLVKIGYPESGKNYPVELNSSGQMFVNVPWTDTNTTYSVVGGNGSTGLVKNGSSVTSASGYTACPIISGVPYYKDTNTTYTLSSFGITATAAELNYCDGVTSNIQTQLNSKGSKISTESGGTGAITKQLSPNKLYEFGSCTSLTITLAAETSGILNEYMFEFTANGSATLSLPSSVKWLNDTVPTITSGKKYQVSIVNNLAVYGEFSV